MEQTSEESSESEETEINGYERNGEIKENLPIPSGDKELSDRDIHREKTNLISTDKNGRAQQKKEVKESENSKEMERGRAKSVGRDARKGSKSSSEKLKRSKSMDRLEIKKISWDLSDSSEKEGRLTYFSKMTDEERNEFIKEQLKRKPKYTVQEKYEGKNQDRKRKSRSRSHSRERKSRDGRQRWREESPKKIERSHQSLSKWKENPRDKDVRCDDDQRHRYRSQESREYRDHRSFRDQSHAKKEVPCKYFNDAGFCKYNSGHPDQYGNPKLHICEVCFFKRGEKRRHSQVECFVVDETCMYWNKNGECEYKSGHSSIDGKYARHHICTICFNNGKEKPHPALDCKYSFIKRRRDSPERFESSGHKGPHDEKPCSFFNNNGSCRFTSGHYPGSGGFTKQIHVCSCCKEFLGEDEFHPAVDCRLKKRLSGGKLRMDLVVSEGVKELPCNSFNLGNCVLKSGHRLIGETRFLHICKFCFEYRGEIKYHTQGECRVREKLLREIQDERQSKYVAGKRKKVDGESEKETRNEKEERKNRKKLMKDRSPARSREKSVDPFRENSRDANVTPKVTVNLIKAKHLKPAKDVQIKDKTSQIGETCRNISPLCKQPKHMEEAINQTKSNLDQIAEQETAIEMKDVGKEGHDSSDVTSGKQDLDESEQETSTESDEEEIDSNMAKTILKVKEHGKVQDPPILERNPFYQNQNDESKSNKEEIRNKRRKLEKCTPQDVINLTDASEKEVNGREINKDEEKSRKEGLVPVDEVLKISNMNSDVRNVDSETEKKEREILKKIEHLKKLHTIELENLRKAQEKNAEANGTT